MRRLVLAVMLSALACVPGLALTAHAGTAEAAAYSNTYLLRERLCLLQGYIERYAQQNYNYYPPASMVRRGGGLTAPLWPLNPWTGEAMHQGTGTGDFSYTTGSSRLNYRLAGRYPGGTIVLSGSVTGTRKMQNDHRTREGLELIQQYIEMWARGHDDLYPSVSQVAANAAVGLQPGIPYWPHDPWFHEPMKQSTRWGEFTYVVNDAHDRYSITAHYSRGGTFTLRGTTATSPWHLFRLRLKDEILKRDLEIVDGYLRLWALENNGALPTPQQLAPGGAVGQENARWPVDPYSGEAFTIGAGAGHFAYAPAQDGSYTLTAPLAGSDAPYMIERTAHVAAAWWRDDLVRSGVQAIARGVERYAVANAGVMPRADEVQRDGALGLYVDAWPASAWIAGASMTAGGGPGDFAYTAVAGSFSISAHLSDGTDFVVLGPNGIAPLGPDGVLPVVPAQ